MNSKSLEQLTPDFYDTFAFIYALPLRSRGVSQRRQESTTSSRALRYISSMRYVDSCAMAAGREGEVYLNFVSTLSTSFWQSRARERDFSVSAKSLWEKMEIYWLRRGEKFIVSRVKQHRVQPFECLRCYFLSSYFFIFATSKQVVTDADNFPPISCASLLTHLRLKLPAHIFTQSTGWIIESFFH